MNDRDREILAFERTPWRFEGAKHEEILVRWGLSPHRYYQIVNRLLDDPEAEAVDALTVRRLRRVRAARVRDRSAS